MSDASSVARRFEILPRGPYDLAASAAFLEGFGPAAHTPSARGPLCLAFVVDGTDEPVGVSLTQEGSRVIGKVVGDAATDRVRAQVARILSLDVDGGEYPAIGQRDPVIGDLQQRLGGLRPVCFFSPYEAAAWSIISQRIRIVQAARVKAKMARQLGHPVDIDGETWFAFPAPARLSTLESFPGLFGRKVEWLRAIAWAAFEGRLEADDLRSLPPERARRRLCELPGIGPFSAELILLRGAGEPDGLPTAEPRLARAIALAYHLDHTPEPAEIESLAERWRPYRTWVAVLLRTFLEQSTREIARGTTPPRRMGVPRPAPGDTPPVDGSGAAAPARDLSAATDR